MADVSDLPALHDIDVGYSPQYVRLARALCGKTESGQYQRSYFCATNLARGHKSSIRVTSCTLAMLAANRYLSRPGAVTSCSVTRQAGT